MPLFDRLLAPVVLPPTCVRAIVQATTQHCFVRFKHSALLRLVASTHTVFCDQRDVYNLGRVSHTNHQALNCVEPTHLSSCSMLNFLRAPIRHACGAARFQPESEPGSSWRPASLHEIRLRNGRSRQTTAIIPRDLSTTIIVVQSLSALRYGIGPGEHEARTPVFPFGALLIYPEHALA